MSTAVQEPQVERDPVTFFSYIGRTPSSQIIHISGGGRQVDSTGEIIRTPDKYAKFHNGIHQTSDEETIVMLRRLSSRPGSGITEDREVFYANTMNDKEMNRRQSNLVKHLEAENATFKEENSRLRRLLEERGGKKVA